MESINTSEFSELVKLSKEVESVISNDTLPLLTENIYEPSHKSIFHSSRQDSSNGSRRSFFREDYDGSDDYFMGDSGTQGDNPSYWGNGLTAGSGDFTVIQTSQFLVDNKIKPRDLMESTETIMETIRHTATLRSATLPQATPTQPQPQGEQSLTMSQAVGNININIRGEGSSLDDEFERRVRGRILGFDEYISAQRSAIQDYVTSFSLRAVNDACTEKCQEVADDSWSETLKKFSGVQGQTPFSSYLNNGGALMTRIFSSSEGPLRRQAQKHVHDQKLIEKVLNNAACVESARNNNKTFLEVLAEKEDLGYSLKGVQGFWAILKGMFCPTDALSGSLGVTKNVNSKMLYENAMTFLGKHFTAMGRDRMLDKRGLVGLSTSEAKWQEAYYEMLCGNYEKAIMIIRRKDSSRIEEYIRPDLIADMLEEFIDKKSLSESHTNEVVARLSNIKPREDPYKYAILSIIAKRRENLKILLGCSFFINAIEASWFILSTYQGMDDNELTSSLREGFNFFSQTKSQFKEDDYLKSYLLFQRFNRLINYLSHKDTTANLGLFSDTLHIFLAISDQFHYVSETLGRQQVINKQTITLIDDYVTKVYPEMLTLEQAISYLRHTADLPGEVAHLFPVFRDKDATGVNEAADCAIEVLGEKAAKQSFRRAAEELVIRGMRETALYVLFRADYVDREEDLRQLLGAVLGDTLADPEGHRKVVAFVKENAKKLRFIKKKEFETLLKLCAFFDLCEMGRWGDALKTLDKLRLFPVGSVTVSGAERAVIGAEFPQEAQRNLPAILRMAMVATYNLWKSADGGEKQKYCNQAADLAKFAGLLRLTLPKETLEYLNKRNDEMNKLNYYQ